MLQDITIGDLPQFVQIAIIVGLAMLAICLACVFARIISLFKTVWCILCCCCQDSEYSELED